MDIKNYRDLLVWQKAMDLVVDVYQLVKYLPQSEIYALSAQMRRAAVSIPSNIAEGNSRGSTKEYIHFLYIARGSQCELETQIQVCVRLEYLAEEDAMPVMLKCQEVNKMLNAIIGKLKLKG